MDADGNTKTSYEWTIMEIDPSQSVNTKIGFAYGYLEDRDNLDYKIAFSSFLSVESAMYEMAKLSAITQVDTIDMSKSALASQVFLERMKAEGLTKENYPADSVDGLKEAFNKIVGIKNASDYFRASSAVVEDKLSDYVDFKSGDVDFTLSVDGAEPVKLEKSGQTYTTGNHSVTVDGKVIRWNLENGAALDKDKKYTLSFSVKTNANAAALTEDKIATIISAEADKAYEDAKTSGTAGIEQATASVDTGTFTDKYGYYSNAYANLEYKAASIEGTGFTSAATAAAIAFPMPVVRALKETPKPVTEPEKTATPPAVVKEDKTKDSSSSTTTSDSSTTKTEKDEDVDVSNDSTPESSTNVKNDSTEEGIDIDGDGIPEGSASIKDEESLNVSGGSTPQGGAMLAATGGNTVLLFPALVVLIALIAGVGLIFVIERKSGKNKN